MDEKDLRRTAARCGISFEEAQRQVAEVNRQYEGDGVFDHRREVGRIMRTPALDVLTPRKL